MIKIGQAELHNIDCMAYMATLPDKAFDLAIVDPPYGIGASEMQMGTGKNKKYSKGKNWDNETPPKEYFDELFRVSKNQIIWGGNYFNLPLIKGWIIWDKLLNKEVSFADGEMAWNSFDKVLKIIKHQYSGFIGADNERIHPTQKPIKLYEKLLDLYAKKGQKILDTHLGSGSIAIACNHLGFDLVGCELDEDYYKAACDRVNQATAQTRMF
jgi:site-specific DNA-methyltransferase (adenine-specific)